MKHLVQISIIGEGVPNPKESLVEELLLSQWKEFLIHSAKHIHRSVPVQDGVLAAEKRTMSSNYLVKSAIISARDEKSARNPGNLLAKTLSEKAF